MSVPIFMDLQGFLVGRHFVVKEFAALKDGFELSHYISGCSYLWILLSKSERHQVMWPIKNRYGIQWEDGMIPYWMARSLIKKVVIQRLMMMMILSCTSRDMRNENGCEICSWMKQEKMSMLKISRRITKT